MNRRVDPLTIQAAAWLVGLPYPDPWLPGLRLDVRAEGPELRFTLVLAVDGLTAEEAHVLRAAPIALGLLHSAPITWVTLHTVGLDYDAPYTLGLEPPADVDRVLHRLATLASEDASPAPRIDLHCVDTRSGRLAVIRRLQVTEDWMRFLGRSLAANSEPVSPAQSQAAIQRDCGRWPTTTDMTNVADAAVVAHGGDTPSEAFGSRIV